MNPLLAAGPLAGVAAPGGRGLNLILIVADDQRADTIRALGNDHIQTPNRGSLAEGGLAFTAACCMGSQSPAVCVPARAMLHTGHSLFRAPENIRGGPDGR